MSWTDEDEEYEREYAEREMQREIEENERMRKEQRLAVERGKKLQKKKGERKEDD